MLFPLTAVQQHGYTPIRKSVREFARAENGSMSIFTIFIFVMMLMVTGMAVDLMRFEANRVAVQNTLDRAVLAAADMDQSMTAKTVVAEYFEKANLEGAVAYAEEEKGLNYRTVHGVSQIEMDTFFMFLMGVNELHAPASGGATEGYSDVEVSLALDVSGSMDDYSRLENMQEAAVAFVETVISTDPIIAAKNQTSISIVPFSTTVNAGEAFGSRLPLSDEHDFSHCAVFSDDDFLTTAAPETIQRAGHFDRRTRNLATSSSYDAECRTDANRQILAFENDPEVLKSYINALETDAWTSIEMGAKWASLLLDPSIRPTIKQMADDELIEKDFEIRPIDYGTQNVIKAMVVLSDGANTRHWELKEEYRTGKSDFWYDADSNVWTYHDEARDYRSDTTSRLFWYDDPDDGETWATAPYGDNPVNLTWAELWGAASIDWVRENVVEDMIGESASNTWENGITTRYNIDEKDDRMSDICEASRKEGVIIYAIAFETTTGGDAEKALEDCAGEGSSRFFKATGAAQIKSVFAAIASDITQLKLTY